MNAIQLIKLFLTVTLFNIYISKIGLIIGIPVSLGAFTALFFIFYLAANCWKLEIPETGNKEKLIFIYSITVIVMLFYSLKLPFIDAAIYPRIVAWVKFGVMPLLMFIPFRYKISREELDSLVRFFLKAALIPCLLGLMQFFFQNFLPDWLINFSLYTERKDEHMIGELTYLRTNGMIGNPLEYSFFLLIVQIVSLVMFYSGRKIYFVHYFIALVATITTLSRFAFASSGVILLGIPFIMKYYRSFLRLAVLMVSVMTIIFFLYGETIMQYSNLTDRLLNKAEDLSISNDARSTYLEETIRMIKVFPFYITGYQIGKISSFNEVADKKIHDGFWFAAIIEQGVPFFIFYVFFWIYLLYRSYRNITPDNLYSVMAFFIVLVQIVGGAVNSAYFNLSNCVTIFLFLGFSFYQTYVLDKESNIVIE